MTPRINKLHKIFNDSSAKFSQLNLVIFQEKELWSLGGKCQKQNAIFKSFTTASDKPNRVYANS